MVFYMQKGLSIDGKACCYGTANMDIRSFALNFEVNAMIFDQNIAGEMETDFPGRLKVLYADHKGNVQEQICLDPV